MLKNYWEHKLNIKTVNTRDRLFLPIIKLFSLLGFKPNDLSILGFAFGILTLLSSTISIKLSAFFLLLAILFDTWDGSLARYLNKQTDRGKFLDMTIDIFVLTFALLAMVQNNLINAVNGGLCIFLSLFTLVVIIIYKSFKYKITDWLFKAFAGIDGHIHKYILFAAYGLFAITSLNVLNEAVFISNIYLAIISFTYIIRILKIKL